MKRLAFFLPVLVALILGMTGCSTPAQSSNMATEAMAIGKQHAQTVAVVTGGGQHTNPAWQSKVSDEDLATAISESIRRNHLFSGVVQVGQADYLLNASIVNLSQPLMGFNMTVEIEMLWSLTPKGAAKPVWEKSIRGRSTKGVGDAFSGMTRMRITTEAATKDAIAQAIREIASLELK